jgi:uridylate kinase
VRESRDNPKYKRIVLKLSGEALAGPRGYGIDLDVVRVIAEEIRDVRDLGVETAVVVGGGNIWRGVRAQSWIQPQPLCAWTTEFLSSFST